MRLANTWSLPARKDSASRIDGRVGLMPVVLPTAATLLRCTRPSPVAEPAVAGLEPVVADSPATRIRALLAAGPRRETPDSTAAGKRLPAQNPNPDVDQPSEVQMSGEQQLERSVLEGKERDELHAIAEALGTKPGSRTKKADLIDSILKATGVAVGADEAANGSAEPAKARKPRTPRAKPAADTGQGSDGEGAESGADADGEPAVNGAASPSGAGSEAQVARKPAESAKETPAPA